MNVHAAHHDDFAVEPVRGLPAPLPAEERILWQGAPDWRRLAAQVFHTRMILIYFGAIIAWRVVATLQDGGSWSTALLSSGPLFVLGALALGILGFIAWLIQRTTVYTLTNRRIVLRFGLALPKTINIPLTLIDAADLKVGRDGVGNIPLLIKKTTGIPYLMLWPHVRPWKMAHAQPMLRAVPNAKAVAEQLADLAQDPDNRPEAVGLDGASEEQTTPRPREETTRSARRMLWATGALVVFSLSVVVFARLNGAGVPATETSTVVTARDITFVDQGADRIAVLDQVSGETLTMIEPTGDGLLRGALRGLGRERRLNGIDEGLPYRVAYWDGGFITLTDPQTGRHIKLTSFGPVLTGAQADLMTLVAPAQPEPAVPPASE